MEALPLGTVEKTPGITSRPMRGWPTSGLWGPLFDSRVCSPFKENNILCVNDNFVIVQIVLSTSII